MLDQILAAHLMRLHRRVWVGGRRRPGWIKWCLDALIAKEATRVGVQPRTARELVLGGYETFHHRL